MKLPPIRATADDVRSLSPLLAVALICLLLGLGGEEARQWGRYERAGIEAGEWWRLVTAHFVHLDWPHLWLNLLGLGLLAALLHGLAGAREWLAVIALGALGIDAGIYLLHPEIHWYVGLSGVLHAMLALGAVRLLELRAPAGLLLGAGLAAKLAWEQWAGPVPLSGAAVGPVVVEAHLYGALAGLGAAVAGWAVRRPRLRRL